MCRERVVRMVGKVIVGVKEWGGGRGRECEGIDREWRGNMELRRRRD